MAVSANRLELLQIADAVAREKAIDRGIVIAAMEDAIAKAARSRYGAETDVHAEIEPKTGELAAVAPHAGGRSGREPVQSDHARRRAQAPSGGPGRRYHRRSLAAAGIRPHRRAVGQAGHRAEGARGRARPAIRRIQGPHRRHRQRHRQARRIRQRGGRSRPRRGDRAARRDAAARGVPQRRPHPRLYLRRAARAARAADFPVAHASAIHGQAVRAGSAGNLRRHRRGEGGRPRPRLARQDRGDLARFLGRPGRRLRRHARLARAGGGQRIAGREDRHHSVVARHRDLRGQRAGAGGSRQGRARRGQGAHRGGGARPAACRSPSAGAARTCVSPRSSPAGTSTS